MHKQCPCQQSLVLSNFIQKATLFKQLNIQKDINVYQILTDHSSIYEEWNSPQHDSELAVADLPVPILVNNLDHLLDFIHFYLKNLIS